MEHIHNDDDNGNFINNTQQIDPSAALPSLFRLAAVKSGANKFRHGGKFDDAKSSVSIINKTNE